jgi:hypothetical protein
MGLKCEGPLREREREGKKEDCKMREREEKRRVEREKEKI